MAPAMTRPDCGLAIRDSVDLAVGRRVHRLSVRDGGAVEMDRRHTATLWHCGNCDLAVGVS